MRNPSLEIGLLTSLLLLTGAASAADPAPSATPPPAPYSLPWQLRPAQPVSVVRSDTTLALHEGPDGKGTFTLVSLLLASYKVTPELAPFVRIGVAGNPGGAAATNLAAGATLGVPLGRSVRMAFFLGLALPIGSGGGDTPDPGAQGAVRAGVLDRSAMDNAMFAVNDLTLFPGVDVAYVAGGWTVQLEATVLALSRLRGEKVQVDASKTNLTTGLHVGYFLLPELSVGAELRYQRWLSSPAAVAADATGDSRDNLTFAAGPRAHLQLARSLWIRPGISYSRGLDLPMSNAGYNILQVDVPVLF